MNTITSIFQQAELAEAAYANFFDNYGNLITNESQLRAALTTGDEELKEELKGSASHLNFQNHATSPTH